MQVRPARLGRAAPICRAKILSFFPRGFRDPLYLDWERSYKWSAHRAWADQLGRADHAAMIRAKDYEEIAQRAVRIVSRTNVLLPFERMALREAIDDRDAARLL